MRKWSICDFDLGWELGGMHYWCLRDSMGQVGTGWA
jgi:hypothetical protein